LINKPEKSSKAFIHIFDFVFREIKDRITDLCENRNGLCVVKIIVAGTTNPKQQRYIMSKITEDALKIVCDPFGNYAITEIISWWPPAVCQPIFQFLKGNIYELCKKKYSSPVIEKCIEFAPAEVRSQYLMELVNCERLANLITNSFGNYVIQKSLKIAQGSEKDALIAAIQKSIPAIPDRKIRKKWERIIATVIQTH
jgi:hypothetical protein